MVPVVTELLSQKPAPSLLSALSKMIEVEQVEREVRRIRYQMTAAKFPQHKDFATFDYAASAIEKTTFESSCTGKSTRRSYLILVGGTGTGKPIPLLHSELNSYNVIRNDDSLMPLI